jgi:hypothetical protein
MKSQSKNTKSILEDLVGNSGDFYRYLQPKVEEAHITRRMLEAVHHDREVIDLIKNLGQFWKNDPRSGELKQQIDHLTATIKTNYENSF